MILKCPFCNKAVTAGMTDCPSCAERMVRHCPSCAEDISVKARDCKYCGEKIGKDRPVRRPVATPVKVTPDIEFVDEPTGKIPWEDTSRGFLSRWWGTWFSSQLAPKSFFAKVPATGGHRWPIGYAFGLAAQTMVMVLMGGSAALGLGVYNNMEISNQQVWNSAGMMIAAIPATFIGVTILLYFSAFLWHILLKMLGGKAGFEGTLRIVGYSSHTGLWVAIPYLGWLIGAITWTRLHYHGFREIHKLSGFRALFATSVPFLVAAGMIAAAITYGGCGSEAQIQTF